MTERELKEIGEFVVRLREAKHWSQREAANALGVSNGYLSQIESGSRELSSKLVRISIPRVFNCPDDWIERIHEINIETVEEKIRRLEENIEKYSRMRDVLFNKLERRGVFIIGDLCVDEIEVFEEVFGTSNETTSPIAGGQGLNASIAFQTKGYIPVLFGGIGKDYDGEKIVDEIENRHIISLIKEYTAGKKTARCLILFNKTNRKKKYDHVSDSPYDANDFSFDYLRQMVNVGGINKEWFIYFIATIFPRHKLRHIKFEEYEKNEGTEKNPFEFYRQDFTVFAGGVMGVLYATGAPVIVRVPQTVDCLNLNEFNLFSRVDFLIGEYLAFVEIFKNGNDKPNGRYNITEENEDGEIIKENIQRIVEHIDGQAGQYLMFFYGGVGNIDRTIFGRRTANGTFEILEGPGETGYAELGAKNEDPKADAMKRIGFIDRFIADFIWEHDPRNPAAEKKWHWEWPKREK